MHGLITMPVAKAAARLSLEERRALWTILSSKPQDLISGNRPSPLEVFPYLHRLGSYAGSGGRAASNVNLRWRMILSMVLGSSMKAIIFSHHP
jgi:hypothetical protein